MTFRGRLAVAAIAVLALAVAVQSWRIYRADQAQVAARAAVQAADLRAAGWQRAATASAAELARVVPELQAQIDAARRTGAVVAGTQHWQGTGAGVPVPCPTLGPPASGTSPGQPSPAGQPEAPLSVTVTPHVRIDDAVALDDAGGIYVARRVQARLTAGLWESAWGPVEPEVPAAPVVDTRLAKAWAAYRNPPPRVELGFRPVSQWRAGWVAGAGLSYDPFAQRLAPAVFVGWGISF